MADDDFNPYASPNTAPDPRAATPRWPTIHVFSLAFLVTLLWALVLIDHFVTGNSSVVQQLLPMGGTLALIGVLLKDARALPIGRMVAMIPLVMTFARVWSSFSLHHAFGNSSDYPGLFYTPALGLHVPWEAGVPITVGLVFLAGLTWSSGWRRSTLSSFGLICPGCGSIKATRMGVFGRWLKCHKCRREWRSGSQVEA